MLQILRAKALGHENLQIISQVGQNYAVVCQENTIYFLATLLKSYHWVTFGYLMHCHHKNDFGKRAYCNAYSVYYLCTVLIYTRKVLYMFTYI